MMNVFLQAACAAVLSVVSLTGRASTYSHVAVDATAVPEANRFVGDIFEKRVAERVAASETNGVLKVRFRLEPSLGGEVARVIVKDGSAEIVGARVRSLYYGAGALLRAIAWKDGCFAVEPQAIEITPAKPIRIVYWARHFHNWYQMAPAEELEKYAEDMMLMGLNGFHCQYDYPVEHLAGSTPAERAFFADGSRAFYRRIVGMDADYVMIGGGNQLPQDSPKEYRGARITDPKRGNYGFNACPAKPGALDYILKVREGFLERARQSGVRPDYFVHWPYDEGGCECAVCKPWGGNGYLKLLERIAVLNRGFAPKAKAVVSTWTFDADEYRLLWDYLAKPESEWIGALMIDSHGDFPEYPLTHALPRPIPIISFPEISMWQRRPWGGYGAIAMPARFERLFRQVQKIVSGCEIYSEGIYEDLNKFVVAGLYVDPSRTWQSLVAEYGRYHFPGADEREFVRFVEQVESQHVMPGDPWDGDFFKKISRETADAFAAKTAATQASARRLEAVMLPWAAKSWRWRIFRLRVEIDAEMFASRQIMNERIAKLYRELIGMYRAEPKAGDYHNWVHKYVRPLLCN